MLTFFVLTFVKLIGSVMAVASTFQTVWKCVRINVHWQLVVSVKLSFQIVIWRYVCEICERAVTGKVMPCRFIPWWCHQPFGIMSIPQMHTHSLSSNIHSTGIVTWVLAYLITHLLLHNWPQKYFVSGFTWSTATSKCLMPKVLSKKVI